MLLVAGYIVVPCQVSSVVERPHHTHPSVSLRWWWQLRVISGVEWCPHPPLGYLWGAAKWLAHLSFAGLACLV